MCGACATVSRQCLARERAAGDQETRYCQCQVECDFEPLGEDRNTRVTTDKRLHYASCLRRTGDSITRAPWLKVMAIPGQRSQAAR
jgi:hypothetical protein